MNLNIIKSIFNNHSINKAIFIEERTFITYIIYDMSESLPLERWEHLEAILKEYTKKEVALLPYNQAITNLGSDYINKGVTI